MTLAAKRHMAKVAELPCCLCLAWPVEVHHVLEERTPGRKSPDWLTIPLCPECHRGNEGIHGTKAMLRVAKKTEMELLAKTLEAIYGQA